ncbi:hypothetical protein GGQ86_002972 [Xanthobacter flavus]|uniref:Uncharacterized protein n=1 Tax=Xanthobacter flavus TaxID=281 RepID=A0A9W6FKN4_XANFL|nr:hypothetical protein [Xanthobacter flavus]MDR6334490.1 hypothetical protein [Xanthobacter flavus]GLI23490.1 hypothetical protein XFLAVUS301_31640 [Xanthobacter flavus]
MDILAIQPNTITVEITHPKTGAPIGLSVECVSLESDAVKAVERQIKNAALKSGRNAMTAEKMEKNTVALLAASIVGWSWAEGLTLGSLSAPPLTSENKAKLLSVPWVAKQIDTALGDEAAFFGTSESA